MLHLISRSLIFFKRLHRNSNKGSHKVLVPMSNYRDVEIYDLEELVEAKQWDKVLEYIKTNPEEIEDIYGGNDFSARQLNLPVRVQLAFDEIYYDASIYNIQYSDQFLRDNFDCFVKQRMPTEDDVEYIFCRAVANQDSSLATNVDTIYREFSGTMLVRSMLSEEVHFFDDILKILPEYAHHPEVIDVAAWRVFIGVRNSNATYFLHELLRVAIQGKLEQHHHLICQQTKVRDVLDTLLGKSVEYEEYRMRRQTNEFKRVLCTVILHEFPSFCYYPHIISPVLFAAMESDATDFLKFALPKNTQDRLQYQALLTYAMLAKKTEVLSIVFDIGKQQDLSPGDLDLMLSQAAFTLFLLPEKFDFDFDRVLECTRLCEKASSSKNFVEEMFHNLLAKQCFIDDSGVKFIPIDAIVRIADTFNIDHSSRDDDGVTHLYALLQNYLELKVETTDAIEYRRTTDAIEYTNEDLRTLVSLLIHSKHNAHTKYSSSGPTCCFEPMEAYSGVSYLHIACDMGLPWNAGVDVICAACPDALFQDCSKRSIKPFAVAAQSCLADLDLLYQLIRVEPSVLFSALD